MTLKKERNRVPPYNLLRSVTVQNWIQGGTFFHPRKFPLCETTNVTSVQPPIKQPPSGKWPLRGGWPLNRAKHNRKILIKTLITGHLIEVTV